MDILHRYPSPPTRGLFWIPCPAHFDRKAVSLIGRILKGIDFLYRHCCTKWPCVYHVYGMKVIDANLKVYGVENFRVADGSITPRATTGNMVAPCVVIGERAGRSSGRLIDFHHHGTIRLRPFLIRQAIRRNQVKEKSSTRPRLRPGPFVTMSNCEHLEM